VASPDDAESDEYVIEAITGGSHDAEDGTVVHRILWEDYPDEICWQGLDKTFCWDFSNGVMAPWRVIDILPPGTAPSLAPTQQPVGNLYGRYCFAIGNSDTAGPICWLYETNGVRQALDPATCTVDGVKVDWVVEMGTSLFADSVLQWHDFSILSQIREANLAGDSFPTLMEAREVGKALPEAIRYGLETLGTPDEALEVAATELDIFMRTPSSKEAAVTMARMHAETLRDRFVPLGTIHNCLSLIRGIDKGQILELQSEIRISKRRDPSNALWEEAGL